MDKRLLYRVVLKLLFLLSMGVLSIVFINSLFTHSDIKTNQKISPQIIELDISGMREGEIRKAQWQGKEINILRLENNQYFTYVNVGDSGNCPLFKEINGLKDICTGTRFDFSGKQKDSKNQGFELSIPPNYINKNTLFIGKLYK